MRWPDTQIPLGWSFSGQDQFTSLPDGYPLEAVQASWENWAEAAPCAGLYDEYCDSATLPGCDPAVTWAYPDASDDPEPGLLIATYLTLSSGGELVGADIIFGQDIAWITSDQAQAANCTAGYALEDAATHALGHVWGLGDACAAGTECAEAAVREATMFGVSGPCSTAGIEPNADDVAGIYDLYDVYPTVSATPTSGTLPLKVEFSVTPPSEVAGISWDFGDETTGTGFPTTTHTYTEAGQFSVSANVSLVTPECGAWSYQLREVAYLTACTFPAPEPGAEGLFQLEELTGLQWQTLNHTDVSVFGCIDTVQWDIFEGTDTAAAPLQSLTAWSPVIEFPGAGTYTVVLNVGGPGGLSAGALTVHPGESAPGTCGGAAAAGCALATALAAISAVSRRRSTRAAPTREPSYGLRHGHRFDRARI